MTGKSRLRFAAIGVGALAAATAFPMAASAQGIADERSIEAIVGSEVAEEETRAAADPDRVIRAIEKTAQNTSTVRKTTVLDKVDIVFLSDSTALEGGPPPVIEAKIKENEEAIATLREELEGNAMLYHALDSRQILMKDVLAIEFEDRNVTVYAAAKPVE